GEEHERSGQSDHSGASDSFAHSVDSFPRRELVSPRREKLRLRKSGHAERPRSRNDAGNAIEARSGLVEASWSVKRTGSWSPAGVEFVQMPAKSADDAGSLGNEILPMVNQELQLP